MRLVMILHIEFINLRTGLQTNWLINYIVQMNHNCMKHLICACLLFISFMAASQSPRKRINFDNDWKFALGHAADATKDFNYTISNIFAKSCKVENTAIEAKFDDKAWSTVQLPHDWAVTLPFEKSPNFDVMNHGYKPVGGLYPQNSIGWYRKHFTIDPADSGQRFMIQFDGIFRDSKIWLNGFYLGNNASGYVGVSYDITDYINYKKENVLVVRADASQYEGWFYEGAGIYRHVWLNEYDNVHIVEHGIQATNFVREKDAYISVATTLSNKNLSASEEVQVYAYVTDRNGKKIAQSPENKIVINGQETRTEKQIIALDNPHLWSLEDPYLYKIVVAVKSGAKILDSQTIRFGIRTFKIDEGGKLLLNGKNVKVLGVNCHQDHAGVGSALPDYLQYYRIKLLKEMGVNSYRTSHNAPTPELLDACDSLGMLVMDEQRLLNSSPEYVNQLERLVKRDRNHPSIFMWSIGNEEQAIQWNSLGKRIAQTLLAKMEELDPSRTSTYAADMPNVFHGVNEVIPVRGFNYRIMGVDPYHNDHPKQPIIGTEMGSTVTTRGIHEIDSVRAYVPDQDITYPWWANTAEQWWTLCAERDWWMGGFVWTGFDYRGEPTPFEWPNINSHFGIMDMCGFPKNIYYYYQSWWTDKDVLHLSPHWNLAGKEGKKVKVWVNTNAQEVELFLNGKSLGKKQMPRNQHLEWEVVYKPGILEAVATKNGKKIRAKRETTDAAYQVVLAPDRTVITADGKDATVINVSVKDKKGREVPDAANLIQFSLTGDAKMIGVGNGDPSSHEPDQYADGNYQRKLFSGKCQLIVQAGTSTGKIEVKAVSAGLVAAQVVINTQ
jgi:beta-galactosidase